jgi:[histone H3]-lysine4 N-trimethyltransferase ASH1L
MSITSEISKQDITLDSTSVELPALNDSNNTITTTTITTTAAIANTTTATITTTTNDNNDNASVVLFAAQSREPEAEHIAEAIEALVEPPTTPSAVSSPAVVETDSARPRRQRNSLPVYNLAKLSGTAVHGKRRANGDIVADKKRRTASDASAAAGQEASEISFMSAKEVRSSPKSKSSKKRARSPEPAKRSTRSSGLHVETLATKLSSLGKRSKKNFVQSLGKMSREMRRLQDTNEFSGIDTKPVIYTTWAKGKYVDPSAGPPRKKAKVSEPVKNDPVEELAAVPEVPAPKRRVKKWLGHGLYSGQNAPLDVSKHLTPNEKKALIDLPELVPAGSANKVLPMPIFTGLRLLIQGRDFKLPFDICNPLPSGQPKPASWKLMTRSKLRSCIGRYQC